MKKFIVVLLMFTIGLTSCKKPTPTYISTNEILSFEGQYYVYFHSKNCPACVSTTEKLTHLIGDKKIDCYFFDTDKSFINSTSDTNYSNVGVRLVKDIKIRAIPTLLFVDNGVIKKQYVGSAEILNAFK